MTVVAAALALAVFVRVGRRRVTPPPGARVLVYGRGARAFVWTFLLVPIAFALAAALQSRDVPAWVGALGILAAAPVAILGRIEVLQRAVALDEEGLVSTSAWGAPRRLAWMDVDRVKLRGKSNDTIELRGRSGAKVRISTGMTGLADLAELLARHVPAVPDVPRVLGRLPGRRRV